MNAPSDQPVNPGKSTIKKTYQNAIGSIFAVANSFIIRELYYQLRKLYYHDVTGLVHDKPCGLDPLMFGSIIAAVAFACGVLPLDKLYQRFLVEDVQDETIKEISHKTDFKRLEEQYASIKESLDKDEQRFVERKLSSEKKLHDMTYYPRQIAWAMGLLLIPYCFKLFVVSPFFEFTDAAGYPRKKEGMHIFVALVMTTITNRGLLKSESYTLPMRILVNFFCANLRIYAYMLSMSFVEKQVLKKLGLR